MSSEYDNIIVNADEQCLKISYLPDNCFHWLQSSFYDNAWVLQYDVDIKKSPKYANHPHFKGAKEPEKIGCGNPYNLMTEEERINILLTKPK